MPDAGGQTSMVERKLGHRDDLGYLHGDLHLLSVTYRPLVRRPPVPCTACCVQEVRIQSRSVAGVP